MRWVANASSSYGNKNCCSLREPRQQRRSSRSSSHDVDSVSTTVVAWVPRRSSAGTVPLHISRRRRPLLRVPAALLPAQLPVMMVQQRSNHHDDPTQLGMKPTIPIAIHPRQRRVRVRVVASWSSLFFFVFFFFFVVVFFLVTAPVPVPVHVVVSMFFFDVFDEVAVAPQRGEKGGWGVASVSAWTPHITTTTTTTTYRWMLSSSTTKENEDDRNTNNSKNINRMTSTATNVNVDNNNNNDSTNTGSDGAFTGNDDTAASTPTSLTIPANLRRKIQAKRPTLGHVVPYRYRDQQPPLPQQVVSSSSGRRSSSSSSGGSVPSQLRFQGPRSSDNVPPPNSKNYLIQIRAGLAKGRKLESPSTVYLRPMMGKVKEAIYSTLTSFGIYHQQHQSRDSSYNAVRHLDVFAGSGSVGLESLSRGATHCTFVDLSTDCCRCIQRNIDRTGLGTTTNNNNAAAATRADATQPTKSTLVCCADAMTALTDPYSIGIPPQNTPYQIVTICPPYEEVVYGDLLEAVVGSDTVTEDTIVIIEYPIELLQKPPKQQSPNGKNDPASHVQRPSNYGMPHVIHAKSNTAIGIRNRKYGRTVIAFYIINPTGRYPDASSRPEEFVM